MHILSENDIKALEALATYQYLSPSQMERLGVGKKREYIRQHTLARLTRGRSPLIKYQDFGVIAGKGRLERIYFLTDRGAREAAEIRSCDLTEICYPKYGLRYQNDYFHRKSFVDFHIWLSQWIDAHPNAELEFFNPYFVKDRNRRSINQFRFKPSDFRSPYDRLTIEPDGVFRFTKDEKPYLCAVEIHRKPDTKVIVKQLDQHMEAMQADQNLIAEKFEHNGPIYLLSVYEHQRSFDSVKARLNEMADFAAFRSHFLFGTMAETVLKNGDWVTSKNQHANMF